MLKSFNHLLVPLDFTTGNDAVLSVVDELVGEQKLRISLIHVVEPIEADDDPKTQSFTENLTQQAGQKLQQRADQLKHLNAEVVCENRLGKRHVEVIAYARDQSVDLILLNSHLISPDEPASKMFSLSYQIALMAPCAVMMLKQG